MNNLLRNKPPSNLKDLSPEELRIEAARRETLEIKAGQDIDTLKEHAVHLVYARELLKAKNNELKQMLSESQVRNLLTGFLPGVASFFLLNPLFNFDGKASCAHTCHPVWDFQIHPHTLYQFVPATVLGMSSCSDIFY